MVSGTVSVDYVPVPENWGESISANLDIFFSGFIPVVFIAINRYKKKRNG